MRHRVAIALSAAAFTAAQLVAPASAHAQAWVPQPGDGAVSFVYQNQFVDQHTLDNGTRIFRGETRTHVMAVDLTYGLTGRVGLNVSLPFIVSKYNGVNPHTAAQFGQTSVIDFGGYHASSQDFRIDLRFSAIKGATLVTPYMSGIVPSRSYDFFGHAAAGRRVGEVQIGTYVGRMLDPVLPGGFVQARYGYGFAQPVAGVHHDRSVVDGEVGYFVRPSFRVFGLALGQITHGGVRFTPNFPYDLTPEELINHDRISRVNFFDFGGGAQFSLKPSLDLFSSIVHTGSMTNGHALKYSISTGVSWNFHRSLPGRGASASKGAALAKCTCL
jgi:hypothetical protein